MFMTMGVDYTFGDKPNTYARIYEIRRLGKYFEVACVFQNVEPKVANCIRATRLVPEDWAYSRSQVSCSEKKVKNKIE